MNKQYHQSENGSILMVTLVIVTVMALSVAGFLKLASSETRISHAAFQFNQTLNLAEAGVELSLDALNNGNWGGWVQSGNNATLSDHRIDLGNGDEGVINIIMFNYLSNPRVVSEGRIETQRGGSPASRQVDVRLSRRSLFANGLTARETIRFAGGNAMVDSYDSRLGPYTPFLNLNRNDRGFVASASVEVDSVTLSNASIWGYVATGGAWPNVGPNGTIRGFDSPPDNIDPERVARDFAAEFPPVVPPSSYDGYLGYINHDQSLGVAGANTPQVYLVDRIRLQNRKLEIWGPVVLHVTGDTRVGGASGEIVVHGTGSLIMYVDGDMDVGGNGVANLSNVPANLMIFGSAPSSQEIKLHGNGAVHAAVYAPNAELDLKGGGNSGYMAGAAVANNIFINGTYEFHCDEALADLIQVQRDYRMDGWRELLAAHERISFK